MFEIIRLCYIVKGFYGMFDEPLLRWCYW